jgi:hypothetical protein
VSQFESLQAANDNERFSPQNVVETLNEVEPQLQLALAIELGFSAMEEFLGYLEFKTRTVAGLPERVIQILTGIQVYADTATEYDDGRILSTYIEELKQVLELHKN